MKRFAIKVMLVTVILPAILFATSISAHAYNYKYISSLDRYMNGDNNPQCYEPGYEIDWGVADIGIGENDLMKVPHDDGSISTSWWPGDPPAIESRYNHWQGLECTGGWSKISQRWTRLNEVSDSLNYYWGYAQDGIFHYTYQADSLDDRTKAFKWCYPTKRGCLTPPSVGGNGGPQWRIGGVSNPYKQTAIIFYKRMKSAPRQGENYIKIPEGSRSYSNGDTTWCNSGEATFRTWGVDLYPDEYGPDAQYEAGVRGNWLEIYGSHINCGYKTDREKGGFGYNEDYKSWTGEVSGRDSVKTVRMYGVDEITNFRGYERPTAGTEALADVKDGEYYCMVGDTMNVWGRDGYDRVTGPYVREYGPSGANGYTGFKLNSSTGDSYNQAGNLYKYLKVDDQPPVWGNFDSETNPHRSQNGITISNSDVDGFDLDISNIRDYSGPSNDKEGCGTSHINVAVYPTDEPSNAHSDEVWWRGGYDDSTQSYHKHIYYRDLYKYKMGKFAVDIYFSDNLGNTIGIQIIITRGDPTPEDPKCELLSWHYADPESRDRWINASGDVANIRTNISSSKKFSQISCPTATTLNLYNDDYDLNYEALKNNKVNPLENTSLDSPLIFKSASTAQYITDDKRSALTTLWKFGALPSLHDTRFDLSSSGYTIYDHMRFDCSTSSNEKNGLKLCIDAKPPELSYKKVKRHAFTFTITDNSSGLATYEFLDPDTEELLDKGGFDNSSKHTTYTAEHSSKFPNGKYYNTVKLRVTDNVGNSKVYDLKDIDTQTDSNITVDGDDPFKNVSLNCEGVEHDGRRMLEVKATGSIRDGYSTVDNFIPIWRLNGHGAEISYDPSEPIMTQSNDKLDTTQYVDDNYNSPTGPSNFKYNRSTTDSSLVWDDLADPKRPYDFNITSKLDNVEDFQIECDTKDKCDIQFASGFDHYSLKVYRVSSATATPSPSDKPLIDEDDVKDTNFSLNHYRSGYMYAEIVMYDYNKNPSGKSICRFYHDQPANYSPFSVEVSAVKDVDWEGLPYPLTYGETDSGSDYDTAGKDADLFPLGKACYANKKSLSKTPGDPIAKGYGVKFRIIKENRDELKNLTLKYEFYGESGQKLKLSQEGTNLETVDTKEHTNFTSQVLSPSELSTLNDKEPVYLEHFLPVNFTAVEASTGKTYTGDVTIKMVFIPDTIDNISGADVTGDSQSFNFYTYDCDKTALDDVVEDKQR